MWQNIIMIKISDTNFHLAFIQMYINDFLFSIYTIYPITSIQLTFIISVMQFLSYLPFVCSTLFQKELHSHVYHRSGKADKNDPNSPCRCINQQTDYS